MMVIGIPDPMSLSQFIPMPQIACPNRPELAECRLYLSMDYERARAQSPVLKTVRPERVSGVRIPPPPLRFLYRQTTAQLAHLAAHRLSSQPTLAGGRENHHDCIMAEETFQ